MQRIQNRFGTAGLVVAIVALVAAMSGGAYAAAHASKAKFVTKAQVLALIKAHPGPAGANGTNGTNGKDGTSGNDGAPGAPGSPGADGKTVLSGTTAPEGAVTGNAGDFYIRTSSSQIFGPKTGSGNTGWGSPTSLVGPSGNDGADGADGADGSPWVVGQAPSGALLKGTWSIHVSNAAENELIPLSISTGVPVGSIAFGVYVAVADQNDPNNAGGCTGTAANPTPTTAPGAVCFYEDASTNLTPWPLDITAAGVDNGHIAGGGGGNVWQVKATTAGLVDAYGTWAMVTQ